MIDYLKRSWAVVNLDAISHNVNLIRQSLTGGCGIMAVVKADGYGHGDKYVADLLVKMGVEWFGVSNIEEALSLRTGGIFHPILIFGPTPPECANLLNEYNLTQTVYSFNYAKKLHSAAVALGVDISIHIKVDTGMSRLGFLLNDSGVASSQLDEIEEVYRMEHFTAGGIYTHFACADELLDDSIAYTKGQYDMFLKCIDELSKRGVKFPIHHCCNSAGTINYPEMHMDLVRPGIVIYGIAPSEDCKGKLDLKPAMELYSTVSMVKTIPTGTAVSYGRCFAAYRDTKIATVSIGYADGYERELSNKSRVLLRGQYAPVVGRVCMDQIMLDVTHIPDVCEGDTVVIVGKDGDKSLSFDEMASLSGTIAYEKVCLIGKRVPRIYRSGGKDVGVVDYIRSHK